MISLAHIGLAGSFGALFIGSCGALAVLRKTPIYFIYVERSAVQFVFFIVYFQRYLDMDI